MGNPLYKSNSNSSSGTQHKSANPSAKHDRNGPTSEDDTTSFSFLFVVNELRLSPLAEPIFDQWGSRVPPSDPGDFEEEQAGRVFRYRDGVVSPASGYEWRRPAGVDSTTGFRRAGAIVHLRRRHGGGGGGGTWPYYRAPHRTPMPAYSEFTVFHCWGALPCVYAATDATVCPVSWDAMSFRAPEPPSSSSSSSSSSPLLGTTHILAAGPSEFVAGRGPSWMPMLVHDLFRNPDPTAPLSRGLGGELPVILAQMALSQPRGRTDVPFIDRWWHRGRWNPRNSGTTIRRPLDLRGVLVVVALDRSENPEGSTIAQMEAFENGVVVLE
ncbi:hypothetical protein SAMD00023353_6300290 [Rosellinia necatrix]|uniref:Uncharacterized protein n=1 Tax=Rosellinia necatrix TaxID=77044 RepID=A0A1W2TSA5_ROSNE|nr:hypothetical protein SAMD00023353_6300290 [Rosellinia necatrix]